ncbi:MAG TPA: SagB/ThcOx family dehydrogenase, partial [Bacteroidales bacterium]|nr:SagB/ThcOx family dehydrogenase [Bacteroidales bacterium]
MKSLIVALLLVISAGLTTAQESKNIVLNPPGADRGLSIMKSLSLRASVNEYKPDDLALQDLSDLVWAANGINRPENG